MSISLKERLLKVVEKGLPFMEDRKKGEQLLNEELSINNFGFLTGEDGEYVVYTLKGNDNDFFFGGTVLTERLKLVETSFSEDEVKELLNEGITVILKERKAEKSKRKYVDVEFI